MAIDEGGTLEASARSLQQWKRCFFMAQIVLRVVASVFTAAAIPVMVTSDRTFLVFGIEFVGRYGYFSAFKFLVAVDAVVCAFSVGSLILVCFGLIRSSETNPKSYFFLCLHDMAVTVLAAAGCAAATAIGCVAYNGVEEVGWSAVCENAGKLCKQIVASVALSYVAFFAYLALTALSVRKLMSTSSSLPSK